MLIEKKIDEKLDYKSLSLQGNRVEHLYQRLKSSYLFWVLLIAFPLASCLVFEIASLIFFHQRLRQNPDKTQEAFYAGFYIPRLFFSKHLHQEYPNKIFIGNLLPGIGRWKEWAQADTLRGWRLNPSILASHYDRYIYVHNSQGFASSGKNDYFYEMQKPPGVFRVIILGGSTVYGTGVKYPRDNLPAQVQAHLDQTFPGKTIEVINGGVGGYFSGQEFTYLKNELIYYNPDLVIFYDGWNDQSYNNLFIHEHGEHWSGVKVEEHLVLEERLRKSYTVSGSFSIFMEQAKDQVLISAFQLASVDLMFKFYHSFILGLNERHDPPGFKEKMVYYPESALRYVENLEQAITLGHKHDFKVALMLQPLIGVDDKPYTKLEKETLKIAVIDEQMRKNFYDDARKHLKNLKLSYAHNPNLCIEDLSRTFANTQEEVYIDSGHLNPLGNSLVAREILNKIRGCKFL